MAMRAAALLGATAIVIYLVDHQQRVLTPLLHGSAPHRTPIDVDGTLPGRAFTLVTPFAGGDCPEGGRWWLPLLDGTERLGVIEVVTGGAPGDDAPDEYVSVASLLGELVVTRGAYGDGIEVVRRREPMRLGAEMLRAQLPPLTFSTGHVVISGMLEPCYDVGGDAFDYAVNGDTVHLALFDAVGHGSSSGLRAVTLASAALAAYRNARRGGLDLTATYHHIDAGVAALERPGLITAVLAELDQRNGMLRVISAGHPGGLIVRGGSVVRMLPTPTALPVPLGHRRAPVVAAECLEPGDRLLLYTDGIIEARSRDGEEFGLDRLTDFTVRATADGLAAPETARRLVHAILEHQHGVLQDDATLLLVEYRGPAHTPPEPFTTPASDPLDSPGSAD
ncbi:hypothetical protein GCM10010109_23180 [Actinoplanes campanulatus]|nr:hypothetical protein GCM10010109_23180 [Actinoplanes campanulatus]GID36970.1 hypothetical protein Aca09nite_34760 [Actinoplanes campanulatus]